MFQFLKRRRIGSKAATPSRADSALDPAEKDQDENMPPTSGEVNISVKAKPSIFNVEKPTNYTFACLWHSPGGEGKFNEQSLLAHSLKS